MSIASEIQRITGNVADAYTAASGKGATMPATQNSDNLASTINTISTGVTPTGTKQITSNGIHDVTNYANADVQVPTSGPTYYIEKAVDANGRLVGGSSFIDLTGVDRISNYGLYYAYYHGNVSGVVDFKDVKYFDQYACTACFENCTGITEVKLNSVVSLNTYSIGGMFKNCTGIITASMNAIESAGDYNSSTFVGCTSLQTMNMNSIYQICGQDYWFDGCSSLTTFNAPNLTIIYGSDLNQSPTSSYMFRGCTSMTNSSFCFGQIVRISGYNVMSNMFSGCTGFTSISFDGLMAIGNKGAGGKGSRYCLSNTFAGCTNLVTVSFPSLISIAGPYSSSNAIFSNCFKNCTSLQNIYFPQLEFIYGTYAQNTFTNMLTGCSNVTVHFSSSLQSVIGSWADVTNGFGGTNTTVLFDLPALGTVLDFSRISKLTGRKSGSTESSLALPVSVINDANTKTKLDISGLITVVGTPPLYFEGLNVTTIDASSLTDTIGTNSTALSFKNCTYLTNVDLSSLVSGGMFQMFSGCTSLTTLSLPKYEGGMMQNAFSGCTSLSTLYLGGLKPGVLGSFSLSNMLSGCSNVTMHCPSNMAAEVTALSGYPNFGGTNTTVLFDLPATN